LSDPKVDLVAYERDKIKGAIRTDFILSAEIIAIALGTVAGTSLLTQFSVLAGIAVLMTVGVYGFVAAIVKMDDAGLHLMQQADAKGGRPLQRALGQGLLSAAPKLMKLLTLAGTVAMFLVGGGIITHGLPGAHDLIHHAQEAVAAWPGIGSVLAPVTPTVIDAVVGLVSGGLVLLGVTAGGKVMGLFKR